MTTTCQTCQSLAGQLRVATHYYGGTLMCPTDFVVFRAENGRAREYNFLQLFVPNILELSHPLLPPNSATASAASSGSVRRRFRFVACTSAVLACACDTICIRLRATHPRDWDWGHYCGVDGRLGTLPKWAKVGGHLPRCGGHQPGVCQHLLQPPIDAQPLSCANLMHCVRPTVSCNGGVVDRVRVHLLFTPCTLQLARSRRQ